MSNSERTKAQDWLRAVLDQTGETPTSLARKAGLSQSTLTRFLNQSDAPMIKMATLNAVADALGLPKYQATEGAKPQAAGGMAEEAMPFDDNLVGDQLLTSAVAALINDRPGVASWVLNTDALLLAGYRAGDILIVDPNQAPKAGAVVCVQVYQWESRRADIRFRIYQPPYVVAATHDQAHWKPLLIDNDRVVIEGTVVAMVRI